MRTNRYLVRLTNNRNLTRTEIESVRRMVDDALAEEGVKTGNFRISSPAVEFDVFTEAETYLFGKKLEPRWNILSIRRITDRQSENLNGTIEEVRRLFKEERFWECHEVLENMWLSSAGERKFNLQTLILFCAALVHFQRNQPEICFSMLRKYRNRLELDESVVIGIDFKRLGTEIDRILETRKFVPFTL